MPKIISECCELVKLCHIICSGPFFETHCRIVGLPSGKKMISSAVSTEYRRVTDGHLATA